MLRPGGKALIIDKRHDASDAAIDEAVEAMQLGRFDAFLTRATFRHMLRKRAYTREAIEHMAAATPFGRADIEEAPLGYNVWLHR